MYKLKEEDLKEFINDARKLKEKDENTFQKIFYLMKGIQMGKELSSKCTS